MSKFIDGSKMEEEAKREWLNRHRDIFEDYKLKLQTREHFYLLFLEILLIGFVGAFIVNIMASSIYGYINESFSINKYALNFYLFFIPLIFLIVIILLMKERLHQLMPQLPIITLNLKLSDLEHLEKYNEYRKKLKDGILYDFSEFGNNIIDRFISLFSQFNRIEIKEIEKSKATKLIGYFFKESIIKSYDLSPAFQNIINVELKVIATPKIIVTRTVDEKTRETIGPYVDDFNILYVIIYKKPKIEHAMYVYEIFKDKLAEDIYNFGLISIMSNIEILIRKALV